MNNRITWEATEHSTYKGFILGESRTYKAKIHIFTVKLSINPRTAGQYFLYHRLPLQQIDRGFGDLRNAQNHAERYLLLAFELMGFEPAEGK